VMKQVVGRGMALALGGIAIGLAGAVAIGRALTGLLFGVGATDPAVLAGATLVIVAVSLVACIVPAARAARVDPMVALRND
jgi:putative ABC transport system permease protein